MRGKASDFNRYQKKSGLEYPDASEEIKSIQENIDSQPHEADI